MSLNRYYPYIWVVLLSAWLAGCGGNKLHSRPVYTPGQSWSNQVTMKTWMVLPIGIPDADTRDTAFRLDCKVREVDAAERAHIEVTIAEIAAAMISLSVKYDYDSRNDPGAAADVSSDKNAQRGEDFSRTFRNLLGQRYTVVVGPDGRAELGEIDGPLKAVSALTNGDNFGGEQAAVAFYEGYLTDYVAGDMFIGRQAEAFEPNQVWTAEMTVRSPMTDPIEVVKTFNVDGVDKEDTGKVTVSYKLADTEDAAAKPQADERVNVPAAKPQAKGGAAGMQAVKTIGEGTVVYDMQLGRMVSKEDKMRVQVQTANRRPAGERAQRNKIYYIMTRKVEPVGAGAALKQPDP